MVKVKPPKVYSFNFLRVAKGSCKHLHRYLLMEILYVFLVSLAILTFLLVMGRLGKLTDLVVNRGVELKDIFLLLLYSSPPFLTFTLPMALLLSAIVTLGRLAAENEILALKASGINLKSLFMPIVFASVLVTTIGLFNTHYLLPECSKLFRETLIDIIKKGINIESREGIFNDTIPGVVIYIDKIDTKNRVLTGIIISDDRDREIKQMVSAEKGVINFDMTNLDLTFMLENGSLQRWEKASDIYRNVLFKDYAFSMNLAKILPYQRDLRRTAFEMDRSELRKALSNTVEPAARYEIMLELAKKVSMPFSSLAFMLLVLPLGIKRKMGGRFSGAIASLIVFVAYYLLIALTENIGKSFFLPVSAVSFFPNIIVALVGLLLLRNINGEGSGGLWETLRNKW
jgi:lipopolysaccharide export system permease protein